MITLIDKQFGKLKVLSLINKKYKNKRRRWLCKCSCGNLHIATTSCLTTGKVKSCGCSKSENLIGKVFGKLTVLEKYKHTKYGIMWLCLCSCGKTTTVLTANLKSGNTKSCGCLLKQGKKTKTFEEVCINAVFYNYKKRAEKNNLCIELTKEQFGRLLFEKCYYCGEHLSNSKKMTHYKRVFNYNGIDRLDNTKGYTLDNTVSCCKYCNCAKSKLSVVKFISWLKVNKNLNLL